MMEWDIHARSTYVVLQNRYYLLSHIVRFRSVGVGRVRLYRAVPWLRRLFTGLSPLRAGFDPGSVHVGFVVDKVALGQVFSRVLRVFPVSFIPPVLHDTEKRKKLIIFITGLQNKLQG
jgi:hypothetical protein